MNFLVLILMFAFGAPLLAQSLRTDLQQSLQSLFCQNQQRIPDTRELWRLGVFETQLDAAWIRSGDDQHELVTDDVAQIAREQALAKSHGGFAFGLCNAQEAWILSTPASAAVTSWTKEGLKIHVQNFRAQCPTLSVHYARATHGLPKLIVKTSSKQDESLMLHPELLEAGTIGLTCHPAGKATRGPELWSLIPIKQPPVEQVPGFIANPSEDLQNLILWVQKIRNLQGLKPLQTSHPLLKTFANQLAQSTSIRHPRALLLEQKKILARKKIVVLGENRVKATSTEQMAWLLWFSPTHRQLLLNKDATALGFDVARLQHEKLLVLVLAKI